MNWGSASEFFAMRGYGLYVWGSYGVTAALMLWETWQVLQHKRRALQDTLTNQDLEDTESS